MEINKKEIEDDAKELAKYISTDEGLKRLNRLSGAAIKGVSLKNWIRRLLFGLALSDAIERWLINFNPSLDKPLGNQIPREETKDVVIAWMRFSIRRALILFLLSSLITVVTAVFLFQQIKRQDEIIKQREIIDKQNKLFLYSKALYDETCVNNDNTGEQICTPVENAKVRTNAVISYISMQNADTEVI